MLVCLIGSGSCLGFGRGAAGFVVVSSLESEDTGCRHWKLYGGGLVVRCVSLRAHCEVEVLATEQG